MRTFKQFVNESNSFVNEDDAKEMAKYGIIELINISWSEIKELMPWILKAKLKDIVIDNSQWSKPGKYLISIQSGDWLDGKWEGDYDEGVKCFFKNGIWHKGIFDGGWFGGGKNAIWKNGIFKKGNFGSDRDLAPAIWEDGVFEGGKFEDAIWKNGTFKKGYFLGKIWENGVWEAEGAGSDFADGRWKNGIFKAGYFSSKMWEDGVFEGGVFEPSGTWKNGVFKGGIFAGKMWQDGVFEGGIMAQGTWKKGTWKKGKIGPEVKWMPKKDPRPTDVATNIPKY